MHPYKKTKKIGQALLLCVALTSALVGTSAMADNEEGMFLDLKVNQTQRGEFPVYRSQDGDFLVRLSDTSQLGLRRDIDWPLVRIEGESGSFVSLRGLGATRLDFDSVNTALAVELPANLFETTSVDLAIPDVHKTLVSEETSGFLNYRLADTGYGGMTSVHTLATEIGLRKGSLLFLNQNLSREFGGNSRYLTQLVYDRPEVQQRFIAGDYTAVSSELGSVLPMGGLNFSKVYSLTPELIQQPLAGFAGVATSPSTVEVRIGGVPVAYSQVGAGPFELQNLRQFGGSSDVQVVVRDALGREQVYNYQFYYADQSLREGLHEYSYSLGKIRTNPGLPNDDYGQTAFSAFHRFGYSDNLTLGGRAEAADDLTNVGVEATWRNDQWGTVTGAVSTSDYQGQTGEAAMLAYSYLQPVYGVRAVARHYSDGYAPLETLVTNFQRRGEYGISLSWYPQAGSSFNFGHTLTESRNTGDTHLTTLSYFQNVGRQSLMYVTLQRSDDSLNSPNTTLFLGWFYRFGDKYTASVNATRDETGQQSIFTQLQKDIPYGEGLGYRVGWTGTQPQNTDRFNGYAQWNLPAAILSVDTNTIPTLGGNGDYHEVAVAGSVAAAGNAWGFSRTITDSFAIVQMGTPLAGVHVSSNSQDIGETNANGQVISPYLGSYYESQISIDDQKVPLQYTMGKNVYNVKPAYRSGVAVNFGLRRVHAIDGVLRIRKDSNLPTADDLLVTLRREGQIEQQFQVGRDGHFYIENMVPGTYQGEITTTDGTCHFALQAPDSQEVVFTLPGDLVCEYAK